MPSLLSPLFEREEALLREVADACEEALESRSLSESLPAQVQAYARHVRSLLDGLAGEIHDHLAADIEESVAAAGEPSARETESRSQQSPGETETRFPISQNAAAFLRTVRADFPGLTEKHPELLRLLMDSQPFLDANSWLALTDKLASSEEPLALSPRTSGNLLRLSMMTYHGEEISFSLDRQPDAKQRSATGLSGHSQAWTGVDLEASGTDVLVSLLSIHDGVGALWTALSAKLEKSE
ncbi:hypothetical protein [Gorillibacterium timonense]|uniref:hypothetical protein n=1 Tax=Gorillibacterium timonense TaxID=1689269 RepID=UPI00071C7C26|nr:hypothetical protein [Gorillibacterium timonense]